MTNSHAQRPTPNVFLTLSLLAISFTGCHDRESDDYKTWAPPAKVFTPQPESANSFDAYAMAATGAEQDGAKYLARVSFFPGQRKEVEDKISERVKMVMASTSKPCDFQFVPHKPFQAVPFQAGWRLIGRAIEWQVEDGCQAADFDKAVRAAVAGTRFGFDLTGGGATDVSLGLSIADDVRKAIAPYLPKMSPAQLDTLAQGLKAALTSKPPISKAISNERQNMLTAIQFLQDSLKSGDLKMVQKNLGTDVDEAVKYLGSLRDNGHKRSAYFDDLAKEGDVEFAAVEKDSGLPVSQRPKGAKKIEEPWRKFAKHLFGTARPMLDLNDATMARTRLLVLYAELTRLRLRNKPYPLTLDGFTPELTLDPYSGVKFLYHADQAEFSLYSVGSNGRDDGGDTDSTYTKPDLRLECPIQ